MGTPALYTDKNGTFPVDVIQDNGEYMYVKFRDGRTIWVEDDTIDFNIDSQVEDDYEFEFEDDPLYYLANG